MSDMNLLDHIEQCWAIGRLPQDPSLYFLAQTGPDGRGEFYGPFDSYAGALAGLCQCLWGQAQHPPAGS